MARGKGNHVNLDHQRHVKKKKLTTREVKKKNHLKLMSGQKNHREGDTAKLVLSGVLRQKSKNAA